MAQLIVRQLDEEVKSRLQERARRHGRSTEEEVREILRTAVKDERAPRKALGTRLASRFARIGLTKEIPELRGQAVHAAEFDE